MTRHERDEIDIMGDCNHFIAETDGVGIMSTCVTEAQKFVSNPVNLKYPLHIDFEITSNCNQRCMFCEARIGKVSPRKDMNTEEIKSVLSKFADIGIYSVFLTGGEPTSRKDLPTIIKHCYDIGIIPSLSTNGTLLTEEFCESIKNAGLDCIQVSIEGPNAEVHDRVTGVKGHFDKLMKNLNNLRKADLLLEVASATTVHNFRYFPEMYDLCKKIGAITYRTLRLMVFDQDGIDLMAPLDELLDIAYEVENKYIYDENPMNIRIFKGMGFKSKEMHMITDPQSFVCYAGKQNLGLLSDGTVLPCCLLGGDEFVLGNALERDLEEILQSEKLETMRNLGPDDYTGECGKCETKWNCYSARCSAYAVNGSIYAEDPGCYRIYMGENRTKEVFEEWKKKHFSN
ncbi:MAG: radical SAM protein [Theionarchaea archaeon]|nr:radical SAM protein [Theionarchaea archaeon]